MKFLHARLWKNYLHIPISAPRVCKKVNTPLGGKRKEKTQISRRKVY